MWAIGVETHTYVLAYSTSRCPQHDRIVLVVLQDGRQLEGELIALTDRFQVGGTVFEPWEIEALSATIDFAYGTQPESGT